jgi:gentisate 1,2-dioxygenase
MLQVGTLAELEREMAARQLGGHWQMEERLSGAPRTSVQPYLWRWRDVYWALEQAGDLVSLEFAGRRTIRLFNPGLTGRPATTHTLHLSVQMVKPGEVADCHRHTIAALRFVVQGEGAYTTVEGQQCPMSPGDLVLTPQWTWHDHTSEGAEPMVWLDGLDVPLVAALQQIVFEPGAAQRQEIAYASDELPSPYGPAAPAAGGSRPYFHYRWSDAAAALDKLAGDAAPDPYDAYRLDYRDPAGGASTLPTIDCALTLLRPGQETRAHRHTSTVIYHAFQGSGTSYVGDERFDWGPGDTFVVPLWHPHRHTNHGAADAVLFSMSDAPVLRPFGLYREEPV